jgi:uncharacterized MAPEG superfamily protein
MVLIILLVLALFVLQTLLPSRFREPPQPGQKAGLVENLGNRDQVRPLTVIGQRAARALANLQEALPVFLTLGLLNLILGTAATLAVTGATLFLVARTVYVGIYLAGIPVVRTLVWVVSWVGLVMMLLPVLERA